MNQFITISRSIIVTQLFFFLVRSFVLKTWLVTIRLVIGSLCGAVIMFESALRRTILQDKFELTFVAPSQVLVKELQESAGENVLIESQLGLEIYDVRIMGGLYFV